jgi:NAD(P)H-hydrate epimerase
MMEEDPVMDSVLVTAAEMQAIEQGWFDQGMPVAALMEKAATAIAQWIIERVGDATGVKSRGILVLAGPGHNGGDALVVARELWLRGYTIALYQPFTRLKPLTQQHAQFADYLKLPRVTSLADLDRCINQSVAIVDGWFGFGQTRAVTGELATAIERINQAETSQVLRVAIDVPTGIHTDTGEVLRGANPPVNVGLDSGSLTVGTAFRADVTLCLGLRKLGLLCDAAQPYVGRVELLPFGVRSEDIAAVFPDGLPQRRYTRRAAIAALGLPRSPLTHKYKEGHLLLICGSQLYIGAAILAGLGARASGVGMLSIVVPRSLKPIVAAQLPEAVVLAADETETGAIAALPHDFNNETIWAKFDAIACGCGLTPEPTRLIQQLIVQNRPLILDADALNILATLPPTFLTRAAPTILTPHPGEFRRLFGHRSDHTPIDLIRNAAQQRHLIIVHKGARPIIAAPDRPMTLIDVGTPGLARGGSGDVLTGLMGGLVATAMRQGRDLLETVAAATWWHAEGGRQAAQARSQLGVDGTTLAEFINRAIAQSLADTQR